MHGPHVNGCRYCADTPDHHGLQYHPEAGIHSWQEPTQTQIKNRMLRRRRDKHTLMLQEYIAHLERSPWACDSQEAIALTDMAKMRDALHQGSDLWGLEEILVTTRLVRILAMRTYCPRGRRALLYLSQELEGHLPTVHSTTEQAEQICALADQGRHEQAQARRLLLWTNVLGLIRHGHGDAAALAEAALGAYDTAAETFVLEHLT